MADKVFVVGDRVYVTDPALAQLREIMRKATGQEPAPNHHGTVDDIKGVGQHATLIITFDDGGAAPYSVAETELLEND